MRYIELRFPSISAVLHCRIVCKPAIVVLFLNGSSQYESLPVITWPVNMDNAGAAREKTVNQPQMLINEGTL